MSKFSDFLDQSRELDTAITAVEEPPTTPSKFSDFLQQSRELDAQITPDSSPVVPPPVQEATPDLGAALAQQLPDITGAESFPVGSPQLPDITGAESFPVGSPPELTEQTPSVVGQILQPPEPVQQTLGEQLEFGGDDSGFVAPNVPGGDFNFDTTIQAAKSLGGAADVFINDFLIRFPIEGTGGLINGIIEAIRDRDIKAFPGGFEASQGSLPLPTTEAGDELRKLIGQGIGKAWAWIDQKTEENFDVEKDPNLAAIFNVGLKSIIILLPVRGVGKFPKKTGKSLAVREGGKGDVPLSTEAKKVNDILDMADGKGTKKSDIAEQNVASEIAKKEFQLRKENMSTAEANNIQSRINRLKVKATPDGQTGRVRIELEREGRFKEPEKPAEAEFALEPEARPAAEIKAERIEGLKEQIKAQQVLVQTTKDLDLQVQRAKELQQLLKIKRTLVQGGEAPKQPELKLGDEPVAPPPPLRDEPVSPPGEPELNRGTTKEGQKEINLDAADKITLSTGERTISPELKAARKTAAEKRAANKIDRQGKLDIGSRGEIEPTTAAEAEAIIARTPLAERVAKRAEFQEKFKRSTFRKHQPDIDFDKKPDPPKPHPVKPATPAKTEAKPPVPKKAVPADVGKTKTTIERLTKQIEKAEDNLQKMLDSGIRPDNPKFVEVEDRVTAFEGKRSELQERVPVSTSDEVAPVKRAPLEGDIDTTKGKTVEQLEAPVKKKRALDRLIVNKNIPIKERQKLLADLLFEEEQSTFKKKFNKAQINQILRNVGLKPIGRKTDSLDDLFAARLPEEEVPVEISKPTDEQPKVDTPAESKTVEAEEIGAISVAEQKRQFALVTKAKQPAKVVTGKVGTVLGNDGQEFKVVFAVKELDEIIGATDKNFNENPKFPLDAQDRKRSGNKTQQTLIEQRVNKPQFARLLTDNPTPDNGPIITVNSTIVVAGNGRRVFLDKIFDIPEKKAQYLKELEEAISLFKILPGEFKNANFEKPVITRNIVPEDAPTNFQELQRMVADFNLSATDALSRFEEAVSQSNKLSDTTIKRIGQSLIEAGPKATFKAAIAKEPIKLLSALRADKIITADSAGKYFDFAAGTFTPEGREFISDILAASVIGDVKLLSALQPGHRAMLVSIAPSIIRLRAVAKAKDGKAWNLVEDVKAAARSLIDYVGPPGTTRRFKSVKAYLSQTDMFAHIDGPERPPITARGEKIFESWGDETPTQFVKRFQQFAAKGDDFINGQDGMFSDGTPEGEFNAGFGDVGTQALKDISTKNPPPSPNSSLGNERGGIDIDKFIDMILKKRAASRKEEAELEAAFASDPLTKKMWEFDKASRQALEDKRTPTFAKLVAQTNRQILDVSGNLRSLLLKTGVGKNVVIMHDVMLGAPARAKMIFEEFEAEVFIPLSQGEMRQLSSVVEAMRTIAIHAYKPEHARPGGFTGENRIKYLQKMTEAQQKKYIPLANKTFALFKTQTQKLFDAGLINQESYDALVETGDYSPSNYLQHIDPLQTYRVGGGTEGLGVRESGIKAFAEGSEEFLEQDITKHVADYIARTEGRIARNKASVELWEFAKNNPDSDLVKIHRKTPIPKDDTPGAKAIHKVPVGWTEIPMIVSGSKLSVIMPNELALEWVSRDPVFNASFARFLRFWTGAPLLRNLATGINPLFAVRNLPRDIIHIWMVENQYSKHLPFMLAQMAGDMKAVMKDAWSFKIQGEHRKALQQGLGMDFLTDQSQFKRGAVGAAVRKTAQLFGKDIDPDFEATLDRKFQKFQHIMGYISQRSEIWTRLALRRRAMRNGLSEQEATWVARNYLDFSQGGSFIKGMDNGMPYLNAGFQATRRLLESAKDDPKAFAAKSAWLYTLALSLGLASRLIMGDDYDKIPDSTKANSFIIPTGIRLFDKDGTPRSAYMKIAKDQGQQLITSVADASLDVMMGREVNFEQLSRAWAEATPLSFSQIATPTGNAIAAYFFNKDLYTNRDIWTGKDVHPREEVRRFTNPFLVNAAQGIQFGDDEAGPRTLEWSPERARAALGKWFASNNPIVDSVGMTFRMMMDELGPEQELQVADLITHELPLIGTFFEFTGKTDQAHRKRKDLVTKNVNTGRSVQRREFDIILSKFRDSKTKVLAKKFAPVIKFINQQPLGDRVRLRRVAQTLAKLETSKEILGGTIPDVRFWMDLAHSNPEVRARLFIDKFKDSDRKERATMRKVVGIVPGLNTKDFQFHSMKFAKQEGIKLK